MEESPRSPSAEGKPSEGLEKSYKAVLLVLFEAVMVTPLVLMCWWVFYYLGGLDWSTENKYKFNWHPLAMLTGMFLLFGNAAVCYRLFPFGLKTNKKIHATLNLASIGFIIFGLVAVFEYHDDWSISNLYTLHSWVGLATATLFIALSISSAILFQDWYPRWQGARRVLKPYHVLSGIFLLFSAFVSIETGIVEKAMFREWSGDLVWEDYTSEAILINLLCSSVLLGVLYITYILYTLPRILVPERENPLLQCCTE